MLMNGFNAQAAHQTHMAGGVSEPPPLLSTRDYQNGRVPLESLSVNHGDHQGKFPHQGHKMGYKSSKQVQQQLFAVDQMWKAKENEWIGLLNNVSTSIDHYTQRSAGDSQNFREAMSEVARKVQLIEKSWSAHLFNTQDLPTVAGHLTQAMGTTNTATITDCCEQAKEILQKHHNTKALPDHMAVPQDVRDLLDQCGRKEINARGANPVAALLAQCERLEGQAYMELNDCQRASVAFLRAVELVNQEEGPEHWVARELASHYHAAQQKAQNTAEQQPPSTPDTVSLRRKHFELSGSQTPPPRKAADLEVFTRGAATPSTGRGKSSWDSPAGNYQFSFGRNWATAAPSTGEPTTPSPARPPRAERKCLHCGVTKGLKLCSKCKKVCFCSQECQTSAWDAGHADVCEDYNLSQA
eukprot:Rhum_TRINITY_DN14164_c9_g1::Rhum_TRINITY_DN14164_c9_g1_i1::g.69106::m.69106